MFLSIPTFDQQSELLPSKIVNPPCRPFKKKVTPTNIPSSLSNRIKNLSNKFFSKTSKEEELAKIAIELCQINPLDRKNDEILQLVKATSSMTYFEQINKKELYKDELMHERCCAIMSHQFIEKGACVFYCGEKADKFYLILRGSAVVLIPKTNDKFNYDKEQQSDKNVYDFSYLLKFKDRKREINDDPKDEENNKLKYNEKLQNTLKNFSETMGGLSFFDLKHPERLFEGGVFKYTFYRDYK